MKLKRVFIIIYLFFFSLAFPVYSIEGLSSTTNYTYPIISSPTNGISKYNITQSVTYQLEINFSLTHKSGQGDYVFRFARLNNRIPNSSLTKYCPPYQESALLYNKISGYKPTETNFEHNDRFNNTFDSFNASLLAEEQVILSQKYEVKLNEIRFYDIEDLDIGTYDTSDEIFGLYCNNSEPYYERDDPSLIDISNSIVNQNDNPIVKAEKIYNYIADYLTYNDGLPAQEKGALWAYTNAQGDCSEYSSLMITLLRIQGIPARKAMGFVISNDPSIQPKVGDSWDFYSSNSGSDFLGHAWVEYFVSNIGWIACDPTWSNGIDYFNKVDYLRFTETIGANFKFQPFEPISEFANPIFGWFELPSIETVFEFSYNIKITVIETDLQPSSSFPMLPVIIIIGILLLAIVVLIITLKKRSTKEIGYS